MDPLYYVKMKTEKLECFYVHTIVYLSYEGLLWSFSEEKKKYRITYFTSKCFV